MSPDTTGPVIESTPSTSARLRRAVAAELLELDRTAERLAGRREELHAELAALEHSLAGVEERRTLLDRLTVPAAAPTVAPAQLERVIASRPAALPRILRGTAIRETAVGVLIAAPEGASPIHYRRWFELLEEAGFGVSGRDPLAVFLTQVSRSPLVRRTTTAGVYELDREAPERLRRQLARLQAQLRETAAAPAGADGPGLRRRREQMTTAIGRVERALEEAARSVGYEQVASAPHLTVARAG